jgi:hypothetical protein
VEVIIAFKFSVNRVALEMVKRLKVNKPMQQGVEMKY